MFADGFFFGRGRRRATRVNSRPSAGYGVSLEQLEPRCVMAAVLPSQADASTLTIAVLGDFGGASTYAGPKLAYTIKQPPGNSEKFVSDLVHTWTPDCVVTVGDNNYEGGAYATIDANIGQYYHDFIYPYPSRAFQDPKAGGSTSPFTGLNYNLYLQDNNGRSSTPKKGYGGGSPDSSNHFFPVPGNHEYGTGNSYKPKDFVHDPDPAPYFDYFDFLTNSQYQPTTPGTEFPLTNGLLRDHNSGTIRPSAYYYTFSQGQAANGPLVQFFMLDSNPWPGSGLITTSGDGGQVITNAVSSLGVPTNEAQTAAIQSAHSAQATCLRTALSESKAVFKIVTFHHAAYTSYGSGNGIPGDDAAYWMQWPFSSWGADAVLSGHKHSYERLSEYDPLFYKGSDLGYDGQSPAIPYWAYGNGGAADNAGIPSRAGGAPGSVMQYSKDVGAMKITATGGSNPTMTLAFVSCMKQDTAKTHFTDSLTIKPRVPPVAAAAPVVRSIVPTVFDDRLGIVTYTVTFSVPVTGVDARDFIVSGQNSRIQRVTGSGLSYVVTVRAGHGVGASHRLQLRDDDSIKSVNGTLALEGTIGADGSAFAVAVAKVRRTSGFAAFAITGRSGPGKSPLRSGVAG